MDFLAFKTNLDNPVLGVCVRMWAILELNIYLNKPLLVALVKSKLFAIPKWSWALVK